MYLSIENIGITAQTMTLSSLIEGIVVILCFCRNRTNPMQQQNQKSQIFPDTKRTT